MALKMIQLGAHAGQSQLARFLTAAEVVAQLQHPNIVQLHEFGQYENLPYFTLEFMAGGSLHDMLREGLLLPKQAADIVESLARAMHYAHQAGIIHRDLKPHNVLLTEGGLPKVTDFGLVKRIDAEGVTASGAVMGTPSYNSVCPIFLFFRPKTTKRNRRFLNREK